jgi:hypothetical protein
VVWGVGWMVEWEGGKEREDEGMFRQGLRGVSGILRGWSGTVW